MKVRLMARYSGTQNTQAPENTPQNTYVPPVGIEYTGMYLTQEAALPRLATIRRTPDYKVFSDPNDSSRINHAGSRTGG